jgi:hypothetical protein
MHIQRRNASFKPRLEELGERIVPSTLLDLTTRGAEGVINGAVFRQVDAQPTGTGFIRSFVRLQTNAAIEQGYNTDARPLQFNENKSPQFTRSLKVGEVPLVSVAGVLYREFLLDVNQKASAPLISLDQLKIYIGSAGNLTGYDAATGKLAGLDPVYDLDADGDRSVVLDYRLNSGSGSGDMTVLFRAELFGADATKFIYLYSSFGGLHGANAGFEEWAVRASGDQGNPPPVEPSSLSGFVYNDRNQNGVFDLGDSGITGVRITLNGINDLGQNVVLAAITDGQGFYQFTGLRPGVYSLLEDQPAEYEDRDDNIGTQGGLVANDLFYEIYLAAGVNGENNNFGEFREDAPH